ncbi:MAG: acyl--CoA ligase [Gammaproteobacteria bacterium]|nr:acyl--CoA ligase [Gammaproteobacteria bacterium]
MNIETLALGFVLVVAVYLLYVIHSLGFLQRIPMLFSSLSCEKLMKKIADRHGDRVLFTLDDELSWSEITPGKGKAESLQWSANRLLFATRDIASILQNSIGVSENERVAIFKKNQFDILIFSYASIMSGAIGCPINGNLSSDKVGPYIEYLNSRVLITDYDTVQRVLEDNYGFACAKVLLLVDKPDEDKLHSLKQRLDVVIHCLDDLVAANDRPLKNMAKGKDDPVLIVHTSGTTGFPKGVIINNRGMCQAIRSTLAFNLASGRDKSVFALPFNHQISHLYIMSVSLLGLKTHWISEFDAESTLKYIKNNSISMYFGFPVTYTQMSDRISSKHDLSSIKVWGVTADASHLVHKKKFVQQGGFFKKLLIPRNGSLFIDGLGSSEVGIAALLHIATPWSDFSSRNTGKPVLFGPKVKVVNEQGEPVKSGEVGRLFIKGASMFSGYWNEHSKLFESSRDGWWFTGDMLKKESNGSLSHMDREGDVIHGAIGEIYTLPIEEIIHTHEAIYDCCVFGVKSDHGDEVPAVVVALREGYENMTGGKLLVEFNSMLDSKDKLLFVEIREWVDFPLGVTGKTLKRELRNFYSTKSDFAISLVN